MTVTGVTVPSAANNCVIPTFLPMIPLIMIVIDSLTHLVIESLADFKWINDSMDQ
jgi:hypothetical protein